ncbi:hypothetical protein ACJJTC_019434 [Scirpophaga incertulas]
MCAQVCVVEGCNLAYDYICSFSFYNANITSDSDAKRQEWIEGAMHEESECLWRHVSLPLCAYHFEVDQQGLWIDSPMLPELLTPNEPEPTRLATAEEKKGPGASGYQGLFEKFANPNARAADVVRMDHSYSAEPQKQEAESISRLNVRYLVDTLGHVPYQNVSRKHLWIVKVDLDKSEASISQSEQVITKMLDPKPIIEIVPQTSTATTSADGADVVEITEDGNLPENYVFEIAQEQEISMDEVKEIPASENQEWMVNIIPEEVKPKYAYIKHYNTGQKRRLFTADMNEITLHTQGEFGNYYILPDVDPEDNVEITTSYEPENYIVEEYQHLVLEERPRKRKETPESGKRKKKRLVQAREQQPEQIQIKTDQDWVIDNNIAYEQDDDYDDPKKARVRRKNKKYLGYDFVT